MSEICLNARQYGFGLAWAEMLNKPLMGINSALTSITSLTRWNDVFWRVAAAFYGRDKVILLKNARVIPQFRWIAAVSTDTAEVFKCTVPVVNSESSWKLTRNRSAARGATSTGFTSAFPILSFPFRRRFDVLRVSATTHAIFDPINFDMLEHRFALVFFESFWMSGAILSGLLIDILTKAFGVFRAFTLTPKLIKQLRPISQGRAIHFIFKSVQFGLRKWFSRFFWHSASLSLYHMMGSADGVIRRRFGYPLADIGYFSTDTVYRQYDYLLPLDKLKG